MSILDFLLYLVTGVITVCSKDIIATHMNKQLIVKMHSGVHHDVAINFLGLPQSAVTNWVPLTTEMLFSTCSGGRNSRIKVLAGLFILRPFSLGSGDYLLAMSSQFLICVPTPLVSLLCPNLPFYANTDQIGLGLTILASFKLDHFLRGLGSKYSHILRFLG